MKTYIYDKSDNLKRYVDDNIDVRNALCNKSWWVFDDDGEKETFIFKNDGSLIISLSGVVTHGNWEFIPANMCIIISGNDRSLMVHPTLVKGVLFVMQVDGTDNFSFLIDERNSLHFVPSAVDEIIGFIDNVEVGNAGVIVEDSEIKASAKKKISKWETCNSVLFFVLWLVSFGVLIGLDSCSLLNNMITDGMLFLILFSSLIFFVIVYLLFSKVIIITRIKKYIRNHPDAPMNKYLTEYPGVM